PVAQLRLGGQLAVQHEVRGLEIAAALRELLDRVAAVAQDAALAIDERDRALARRRVHERGVVAEQAEVVVGCLDLPQVGARDVRAVGRVGAVPDGQLVTLARAIVDDRQRVRHAPPPRCAAAARGPRRAARTLIPPRAVAVSFCPSPGPAAPGGGEGTAERRARAGAALPPRPTTREAAPCPPAARAGELRAGACIAPFPFP